MRAVYVSYDGALDPLGHSQVVPYVLELSRRHQMALVSFEKPECWRGSARRALDDRLRRSGVCWHPLRYHKSPRVPATAMDVVMGAVVLRTLAKPTPMDIVHCRGDVAMLIARTAQLRGAKLLYDVRGLYSLERTEVGSWSQGGLLDRAVRRVEAENLRAASGTVVLTETALPALSQRGPQLPPFRVIPTCTDTQAFRPRAATDRVEYGLVYAGSLGVFYLLEEMVAFARLAAPILGRTLFVTQQPEVARRAGVRSDWADVVTARPEEVPAQLRRARAALFFCRSSPARCASVPTKFAEALATGLPVITNRGIGNLDAVIEQERVGTSVPDHSLGSHTRAIQDMVRFRQDPLTESRCRALAENRYSLAVGVSRYLELYKELGDCGLHR